MKGKYLLAIAFLASWTVITANKSPIIFEGPNECPVPDTCPPKLINYETDCSKFYKCVNSQKQLQSCQSGLFFSRRWQGCVKLQNSDCVTPTTAPPPPPHRDCTVEGELIAHECQCTKFYECKSGRKALRNCPVGQFNPASRSCEANYDCKNPPHPTGTPVCSPEGALIPHECKCEKYYQCKNGQKVLHECPKGSHFDNNALTCVSGPCGGQCENGRMKSHECLCEEYYQCINGDWYLEICQNGLHFNETYQKCMNPRDAGCPHRKIGECSINSPSRWAHECDCRLYYQCENKKIIIYPCEWGKYFDKLNLRCDSWANIKDCKNSWDNWI